MASAQKRQTSSKIKKSCPWRDTCGITKKYYGGFLIMFFPPGNIKVCHPNGCFIACHQLLCAAYSHPTTSYHSRSLFDTTWPKPLRCADIIPVKLSSTKGTFAHPALQTVSIVALAPPMPCVIPLTRTSELLLDSCDYCPRG